MFDNSTFKNRIKQHHGNNRFNFKSKTRAVEIPIEFNKNVFVAEGWQDHNCSSTNFIILIDFLNNTMYAGIREEGEIELYSEDGSTFPKINAWVKGENFQSY